MDIYNNFKDRLEQESRFGTKNADSVTLYDVWLFLRCAV